MRIEEEKMSEERRGESPTMYFHSRNLQETMTKLEEFQTEKIK